MLRPYKILQSSLFPDKCAPCETLSLNINRINFNLKLSLNIAMPYQSFYVVFIIVT